VAAESKRRTSSQKTVLNGTELDSPIALALLEGLLSHPALRRCEARREVGGVAHEVRRFGRSGRPDDTNALADEGHTTGEYPRYRRLGY
jgi:hypothetical protein